MEADIQKKTLKSNGPSRIRTCDHPLRRRVLYPLSYRSNDQNPISYVENLYTESCFIGLGGNFTNSLETIKKALHLLANKAGIYRVVCSRIFETTPVSNISQPLFFNACARFETTFSLLDLFNYLEEIEILLGKQKKEKNAPRLIDIDLLFYGQKKFSNDKIVVPHPFWDKRLFVLQPLSDIVDVIPFDPPIDLKAMLRNFSNVNKEIVKPLQQMS